MMLTELFNNPTDLQSFIVPWTQDLLSLSTSGDFVYFFINFFFIVLKRIPDGRGNARRAPNERNVRPLLPLCALISVITDIS